MPAAGNFIAIDPGHSTGIATFEDGLLANTATTKAPHDQLAELITGRLVVCESGPVNHRRQTAICADVEAIVSQHAYAVVWVQPSEWKGHPSTRGSIVLAKLSKHEREAASIGLWFLWMLKDGKRHAMRNHAVKAKLHTP